MPRHPEGPGFSPETTREDHEFSLDTASYRVTSRIHVREGKPCEDNGFLDKEARTACVCDGIGGQKHGELASAMASEIVERNLKSLTSEDTLASVKEIFEGALLEAHLAIVDEGAKRGKRIGTTIVLSKIIEHQGNPTLLTAWVGDSRAHLIRETRDGKASIEILTLDDAKWHDDNKILPEHRAYQQEVQARAEEPSDFALYADPLDPSKPIEPREFVRNNVITQSLGGYTVKHEEVIPNAIEIHMLTTELQVGDKVLLSSDGLHDPLPLGKIGSIVQDNPPEKAVQKLVEAARDINDRKRFRAKEDDIMVQIMSLAPKAKE